MSHPDWGGIPVPTADTDLFNIGPLTLAQGASVTYNVNVTNPGYVIRLELWNSTDNTTPLPVSIEVIWADVGYNIGDDRQIWWVHAGQVSNTHLIRGHGPTVGNQMQITLTNKAASAVTLTYKMHIVGRSITYAAHNWQTNIITGGLYPGFTAATCSPQAGIVAVFDSVSVPAGTTTTLLLPLYVGRIAIKQFANPGSGLDLHISTISIQPAALQTDIVEVVSASGIAVYTRAYLPRVQCRLQLQNTAATAAITTFGSITAADQQL